MKQHHKFGVCRLSIIPVRAQPSDKSELTTQLLFGDHYRGIEISDDNNWLKIKIEFDDYEGWIDLKQHHDISEAFFDHINNLEYKICTDISTTILYKKQLINIVMGSILPIASSELFEMQEQFAFNGESKNLGQKSDFDYVKKIANKYRNAPYLWGGKTPFGIDCSGFTQQVYKICGYRLKRDAWQQYQQGNPIELLSDAQPGDLAFFKNDQNKITHTGIIMENSEIIHASGKVRVDKLDEKGIFNVESQKYTHYLKGIRKIILV